MSYSRPKRREDSYNPKARPQDLMQFLLDNHQLKIVIDEVRKAFDRWIAARQRTIGTLNEVSARLNRVNRFSKTSSVWGAFSAITGSFLMGAAIGAAAPVAFPLMGLGLAAGGGLTVLRGNKAETSTLAQAHNDIEKAIAQDEKETARLQQVIEQRLDREIYNALERTSSAPPENNLLKGKGGLAGALLEEAGVKSCIRYLSVIAVQGVESKLPTELAAEIQQIRSSLNCIQPHEVPDLINKYILERAKQILAE